jgi:chromosome segregation ATPase
MTAEEAEAEETVSPFAELDRPTIVYVCHPGGRGDDFQKLEEIVFPNEKVGLGTKAFRAVKISPDKLEKDPILAEEGSEVPRLLVIDPIKERVKVLEKSKLKAGTFFKEMERAAKSFYEERLDKTVKEHLSLLTEQDQLVNEIKVLEGKASKLEEEGRSGERKLEKVREELTEVRAELEEITKKQAELWKLTPRHEKTSA